MEPTFVRIADAIERQYATLPPEYHEAVDTLRDEIGNALGSAGLCSSGAFISWANTRRSSPVDLCETVAEVMLRVGAVVSHGEGELLVRGGGVYIDDVCQKSGSAIVPEHAMVIRCGHKFRWSITTGLPIR
jgi:hypothetical protein